ncbi:MAG: glycoside hydrolase family protein [Helicobacteraceae bacterium]|jgi:lysozyme|nr:glycoside hydrolase family protein [Helicobacteraceae bacterium]
MALIESIKKHEGFMAKSYDDHLGNPTIGYGTLLPLKDEEKKRIMASRYVSGNIQQEIEPINEKEGEILLNLRLEEYKNAIVKAKPLILLLPNEKADVIYEMCYQMGVVGVLGFLNMWKYLEKRDYFKASQAMLGSKWATQTPKRARELADIMAAK